MDFAVHTIYTHKADFASRDHSTIAARDIADYLLRIISGYEQKHTCKFLAAGISPELIDLSPRLIARLWAELDILPVSLEQETVAPTVDEAAGSMARQCVA